MGDLSHQQSADFTKLTNETEDKTVDISDLNELQVVDVPQQGTSTVLTLTTTAVQLKVGGSELVNRKYIEMQALEKNVKWGYTSTCEFNLFKNQFFALPAGENCIIYLKASTGTADIAIGEK